MMIHLIILNNVKLGVDKTISINLFEKKIKMVKNIRIYMKERKKNKVRISIVLELVKHLIVMRSLFIINKVKKKATFKKYLLQSKN